MTPLEIEVLIHCYVTPEQHPRYTAPAVKEAFKFFEVNDIIKKLPNDRTDMPNFYYQTTERGRALVDLLCNTPLPYHAWVDKDGKVIEGEGI